MGGFGGRVRIDVPEINEEILTEDPCPISWRPNVLAPVLHGRRSYLPDDGSGAPLPLEVVFPALHGNPESAPFLESCGPYPLVILAHGGCYIPGAGGAPQQLVYQHWAISPMARQLARAGYVVVVPQLSAGSVTTDGDVVRLSDAAAWIRTGWEHARHLAPTTGVVGHSRGGVYGLKLAIQGGVQAYAGLSPEMSALTQTIAVDLIQQYRRAQLWIYGDQDTNNVLETTWQMPWDASASPSGTWDLVRVPKYFAYVREMGHYGYLPKVPGACGDGPDLMTELTADLVTMFLGRHLSVPGSPSLLRRIPSTLYFPEWGRSLTPAQSFFGAAYMTGVAKLQRDWATRPQRLVVSYQGPAGNGARDDFPYRPR
jgi:hypothetical protein